MSLQQQPALEPEEAPAVAVGAPLSSQVTAPVAPGRSGRLRLTLRRFARNRLALVGIGLLVLLFLLAWVGPLLDKWSYEDLDFDAFLQPPSGDHWFGTDQSGADLFAQTCRGLQKSLVIGLLVGLIVTALAAVAGASAGYFGGWVDRVIMWVVDLLLVMPSFLIIAVLSPVFQGATWLIFVVLLAAFSWMITARVIRSMTQTLKDREFVKAAKYLGVPTWKIIARHILPNMASLLIIDATIQVSVAIIGESGLSYFGFGIQAPDVSLGTVIAAGTTSATTYQWLFWFPAGCLVLVGLAIAFIGDGLRDALDPNAAGAKAKPGKARRKAAAARAAASPQTSEADVLGSK
ncbi:ABC transporter permease [Streptacidiphilus sp. ASG 303]|uniref:ABC transporter permease n=1 Tax=Streptacidiphilus sp. ASG 303 TaxID=2896847 RepID=UPI001E2830D6|nr:ABC transporter permease [Streptacidiphilus sp. ASG 303]MCD0485689.1 ABC transporter permease [Streptacidiphilus sp. ASG 303]